MDKNNSVSDGLKAKVWEFKTAIERYNTLSWYMRFETLLAVCVVSFQVFSVVNLCQSYSFHSGVMIIFTLMLAYVAADFFNGLVHMMVDNHTNYTSVVGPFIAAFHLHHFKLKYTERHPLNIYFTESGHKFWLVFYLVFLLMVQRWVNLNAHLNMGLVAFGIFSSIAEVSHYWCHNPPKGNRVVAFLQARGILLSIKHHRLHHIHDNVNYAFLNGITDPVLNRIAHKFYKGYKNHSDEHVSLYVKQCNGQQAVL